MYSIPFVVMMGMGVVFIGLASIIFLTMAMSAVLREKMPQESEPKKNDPVVKEVSVRPEDDPKFIAAVFSVLADDMRMDISNARMNIERI